MKHASCLRVTSRSLIVGTGGFLSGAIALPKIDKFVFGFPFESVSSPKSNVVGV